MLLYKFYFLVIKDRNKLKSFWYKLETNFCLRMCDPLIELSLFFERLCSKVIKVDELEKMESQIAVTLCKLEKIFPLAFFDVMVHLPIHLANEAKIAGSVQYRWMYPIERLVVLILIST